jgi:hypothetical protein
MQFVMQPSMVYQYPIWWVLLLIALTALGAVVFELVVHWFLSVELRRRSTIRCLGRCSAMIRVWAVTLWTWTAPSSSTLRATPRLMRRIGPIVHIPRASTSIGSRFTDVKAAPRLPDPPAAACFPSETHGY